jgi:hypothetical protein
VDFYKDLPFRRIWPRDFGRSEFRRIPEAFDQDGLHFANTSTSLPRILATFHIISNNPYIRGTWVSLL